MVRAGGPRCAHEWPLPPGALCGEETLGKSSMARCSLFGSNFINTFDQSMYSFAGSCSYLLAGDCQKHSFSIIGESGPGGEESKAGALELSPGMWGPWGLGKFPILRMVPAWRAWRGMASLDMGIPPASPGSLSGEPWWMERVLVFLHQSCPLLWVEEMLSALCSLQSIQRNDDPESAL